MNSVNIKKTACDCRIRVIFRSAIIQTVPATKTNLKPESLAYCYILKMEPRLNDVMRKREFWRNEIEQVHSGMR